MPKRPLVWVIAMALWVTVVAWGSRWPEQPAPSVLWMEPPVYLGPGSPLVTYREARLPGDRPIEEFHEGAFVPNRGDDESIVLIANESWARRALRTVWPDLVWRRDEYKTVGATVRYAGTTWLVYRLRTDSH